MDKFSFLNSAHTSHFAEMYDQYLQSPDSLEPSWKAFFQGFDFGMETSSVTFEEKKFQVPENIKKEFQVVNLIDAYRKRGHLFTITNPVRERRKYSPTLDIENFGLNETDLELVFSAGEIMGIGSSTLAEIINHLQQIYCDSIGIVLNGDFRGRHSGRRRCVCQGQARGEGRQARRQVRARHWAARERAPVPALSHAAQLPAAHRRLLCEAALP